VASLVKSRLRIRVGRSRQLAGALFGVHFAAAAGVLASELPTAASVALLCMLLANLAYHLRRYAWLTSSSSVVGVELSERLEVDIEDRAGRRLTGTVLGTTFVAPWLIVLNMKLEGSRLPRTLVLMPDATDNASFRAARVWLRWRKADVWDR